MKIKNFRINSRVASKITSCMLLGSLVASTLAGCRIEVDLESSTDLNRALLSIDNNYYVVDIEGYSRSSKASTELDLTDGTSLCVHPSDLQMYNSQSEIMQGIEASVSAVYISSLDDPVEEEGYDRAFVQTADSVNVLEILSYQRWSETNIELTLTDGTTLSVHPMDLTLFNSKSNVMSQVQERALSNNNLMTK